MTSETCLVAEVKLKEKDGSIHAYSDEIPGLHIVGTVEEDVLADVLTGITFLYKEVKNINVEARWVESPATTFNGARPYNKRMILAPTFALAA